MSHSRNSPSLWGSFFPLFLFLGSLDEAAFGDVRETGLFLNKEDLRFLYGEEDAPADSAVRILASRRERRASASLTEDPGALDVTLAADQDDQVEMVLRPNNDLVSPKFKIFVRSEGGKVKEYRSPIRSRSCVYTGVAKDDPDVTAALSNCDGKGFTGVLVRGNETHLIRPAGKSSFVDIDPHSARRRKRGAGEEEEEEEEVTEDGLHVIHNRNKKAKCGVFNVQAMKAPRIILKLGEDGRQEEGRNRDSRKRRRKRRNIMTYQLETAVFVDDELYKAIRLKAGSDAIEAITDTVFTILNGVNILFNSPSLNIHFALSIIRLEIIKSASEGPDKANGNIHEYLSNFCYWQRDLKYKSSNNQILSEEEEPWDHGLLLSGTDLYDWIPSRSSVIGLAWVSGMCQPGYSCSVNEGTTFEAVYVITHELGHNLGMSHDGYDGNTCDSNTYIMSPSTGPGKVTWSSCSNRELREFVDSTEYPVTCILDSPTAAERKAYLFDEHLPGEKVSLEEQCSYALGEAFSPYVTFRSPYEDICREIWCQNGTHAVRTHPALEGTPCEDRKICSVGKCINEADRITITTSIPSTSTTTTTTQYSRLVSATPSTKEEDYYVDIFDLISAIFRKYRATKSAEYARLQAPHWRQEVSTECTAPCGGGWAETSVQCYGPGDLNAIEEEECDQRTKPPSRMTCNIQPCMA